MPNIRRLRYGEEQPIDVHWMDCPTTNDCHPPEPIRNLDPSNDELDHDVSRMNRDLLEQFSCRFTRILTIHFNRFGQRFT